MRPALIVALLLAAVPLSAQEPVPEAKPAEGKTVRVPYRLTPTKHVLVRAKFNGRGPFNFIVDTGAPALFISPQAARLAGLTADEDGWALVERLEVEGGAGVIKQPARVQEPPQLTGMNMVGLPGARLDGVFGYGVLARFRIEIDLTRRTMNWTPLAYEPLPLVPLEALSQGKGPGTPPEALPTPPMPGMPPTPGTPAPSGPPPELAAFQKLPNLLGALLPKRVDTPAVPRGFLGIELAAGKGAPRVSRVLPQGPAARAKLAVGDRITGVTLAGQKTQAVGSIEQLRTLTAQVGAGETVGLTVLRGKQKRTVSIQGGAGF